ncbi:perlucin-like protein [Haliotis rubra]|uniref:perlucin-like protein n=1 Tax=Haliotis rubra TaxID=36100 RepID=UPI001EE5779C|nr:perlucin-like protein [Haliotis rubra]
MAALINTFLLFVLFTFLPAADCVCSCPDGWVVYKNSCYSFNTTWQPYDTAKAICKTYNSYLVRIEDKDENNFISNFILNFKSDFVAWFGANDKIQEGNWIWGDSGVKLTYSNWGNGQPGSESGNEDCGLLQNYGSTFMWYDARCIDNAGHICEKSASGDNLVG